MTLGDVCRTGGKTLREVMTPRQTSAYVLSISTGWKKILDVLAQGNDKYLRTEVQGKKILSEIKFRAFAADTAMSSYLCEEGQDVPSSHLREKGSLSWLPP